MSSVWIYEVSETGLCFSGISSKKKDNLKFYNKNPCEQLFTFIYVLTNIGIISVLLSFRLGRGLAYSSR